MIEQTAATSSSGAIAGASMTIEAPYAENDPDHLLAFIDSGGREPSDSTVVAYHEVLDRLEEKCSEGRPALGQAAIRVTQELDQAGLSQSLLGLLLRVDMAVGDNTPDQSCEAAFWQAISVGSVAAGGDVIGSGFLSPSPSGDGGVQVIEVLIARGFQPEHWFVLGGFAMWLLAFALLAEGIKYQSWAAGFLTRTAEQAIAVASVLPPEARTELERETAAQEEAQERDPEAQELPGGFLRDLFLRAEEAARREELREVHRERKRQRPPQPQQSMWWAIGISVFVFLVGLYGTAWAAAGLDWQEWLYNNPRQLIGWPMVGALAPSTLATMKFMMAQSFARAARAAGALPSKVPGSAIAGALVSFINLAGAVASLVALALSAR